MPIVTIHGVPTKLAQLHRATDVITGNPTHLWTPNTVLPGPLRDFKLAVARAFETVKELGLTRDQVTVLVPLDALGDPLHEVILEVRSMDDKSERTKAVVEQLAGRLALVLRIFAEEHKPGWRKVEVIVAGVDSRFQVVHTIFSDATTSSSLVP